MKFTVNRLSALLMGIAIASALALPAEARMLGNFDEADANHDGKISLQEYQAYAGQQMASRNGRLARRFKALSPQEQQARLKQRFDAADADHNGILDRKEWSGS